MRRIFSVWAEMVIPDRFVGFDGEAEVELGVAKANGDGDLVVCRIDKQEISWRTNVSQIPI